MPIRWTTAFLDASAEACAASERFWATVTASHLSARRGTDGEFATLLPADGDAYLRAQLTGAGPAGVHLDLHVEHVAVAATQATSLGAQTTEREGYVTARSPGGFSFCLVPDEGQRQRPAPLGPAGTRSLVDELCLDIAPAAYDRETRFWSALNRLVAPDDVLSGVRLPRTTCRNAATATAPAPRRR